MHLVFFSKQELAVKFARAIKAANAWLSYLQYCNKNQCPWNPEWAIFLQDFVYNSDTIFVIDPLQYHDGINEEV